MCFLPQNTNFKNLVQSKIPAMLVLCGVYLTLMPHRVCENKNEWSVENEAISLSLIKKNLLKDYKLGTIISFDRIKDILDDYLVYLACIHIF